MRRLFLASAGVFFALSVPGCRSEPDLVPKKWLVAGLGGPYGLLTDATHVYFADSSSSFSGGAAILRMSKEGGLPEAIALDEKSIDSVALDDATVYWVSYSPHSIRAAPKAGGALPRVVAAEKDGHDPGLAVDREHVYYRRKGGPIVRVPKAGGEARVVVDPGGTVAAVDDTHLYYFTDKAILKAPKGERSAPITLVSGQRPQELVIDASHVYWVNQPTTRDTFDGAVLRVAKAGGAPAVVADRQTQPACLAVSADRVWFCNQYYNSVSTPSDVVEPRLVSAPKGGGELATETLRVNPRSVATDGTWLYWALTTRDKIGGTVRRRKL